MLGDTESVATSLDVVVGVVDVVLSVVLTAVLDVDHSVVWVVAIVLPYPEPPLVLPSFSFSPLFPPLLPFPILLILITLCFC